MEIILILVLVVVLVVTLALKSSIPSTEEPHDTDTGTTGNDTYDFLNDATGVDLFDKE